MVYGGGTGGRDRGSAAFCIYYMRYNGLVRCVASRLPTQALKSSPGINMADEYLEGRGVSGPGFMTKRMDGITINSMIKET